VYRKEKGHVLVLAQKIGNEDVLVTRDEVDGFVNDPEFNYFLSVYQYTKLWGMPNGVGWANEPTDILDGITALEVEAKAIEYEEMTKDNKPSSASSLNVRNVT
jgi:hypothetical protein